MKQIDGELQTMAGQIQARHDPALIPLVCHWHLASAAMSKVREKGYMSNPTMDAANAELRKCVILRVREMGFTESKFDAALNDVRRASFTHHALQKIDEVNAI